MITHTSKDLKKSSYLFCFIFAMRANFAFLSSLSIIGNCSSFLGVPITTTISQVITFMRQANQMYSECFLFLYCNKQNHHQNHLSTHDLFLVLCLKMFLDFESHRSKGSKHLVKAPSWKNADLGSLHPETGSFYYLEE